MSRWMAILAIIGVGSLCAAGLGGNDPPGGPAPADSSPAAGPAGGTTESVPTPSPAERPPLVRRLSPRVEFSGKVIVVTLKSDPEYAAYLQNVETRMMGGSLFLVGVGVETGFDDWTAGRRTWVAMDDVSQVIEFDTVADLKKALELHDPDPDA